MRAGLDEYGRADGDLVRVEDLSDIANLVPIDLDELVALVDAASTTNRNDRATPAASDRLDDVLQLWQESRRMDSRPIFACFWEDAHELLDSPSGGWADDLRDRLGLAHLDPRRRPRPSGIPVVAFRYPVTLVPRAPRRGPRYVARPTVLDERLTPSFFTFRAGSGRDCTVDLAGNADEPWQEVVHPAVTFRAAHAWALGTVIAGVPDSLDEARYGHYLAVSDARDANYRAFLKGIEEP